MSYQTILKSSLAIVFAITFFGSADAQNSLAIKGGKIIPVAGEAIENGTLLIRDGKIAAVGTDLDIPVDARIIDATGKVVMPGFVEAHSSEGLSQANETNPNVPYVSVMDGIDPMRPYFDSARRNGVTSVAVVPGNSTMIGGQAAVIKTGGDFVEYMVLKRDAGMKISLRPAGQTSRMGHLAALRKALGEAKRKIESDAKKESGKDEEKAKDKSKEGESKTAATPSKPKSETDSELTKALMKVVSGKLPVFIYCDKAMDVAYATQLINQYKMNAILVLGRDCHKAAKQVAASGLPVILDSQMVFWDKDPRTDEEKKIVVTESFRDQDVPFAFQVARSSNNTLGNNYLWYQAATAVKYGMPKDEALKALTLLPAEFLGVDQFVGSLEKGKDGDVIILTGDPLKNGTWVETTIVNGEVVYERDNDEKLELLLGKTDQK
ncbi:MAG: amidohydrolase family protein [Pirellulaceae bacterium]|nr:amidohydrolase family protein [Pirellulaceae bacterium]